MNKSDKLFMYDFVNKVLPEPLLGIYEYHGDIHGHETRHSTDPKSTELMCLSFLYKGPCIWLAQDMQSKSSNSRNAFKKRSTQTHIEEYYNDCPTIPIILNEVLETGDRTCNMMCNILASYHTGSVFVIVASILGGHVSTDMGIHTTYIYIYICVHL